MSARRARSTSLAERYRAHRLAFVRAIELGCTPIEAQADLEREAALERCREAERRLAARTGGSADPQADAPEPKPFWWDRD